ncbi:CsiV family protein [Marinobacter sp. ASW11-75]|uniref:CsiV family protein n=1 Tax=Marinobacter qingdaonensis TaxID=3108486 RepID=A0ABU5P0L8_9GAMM|nr:CsiV family protein [Marinobacter sp. ASW11-75]MEA1081580.1 CsiV family protein [Marinobacter sp. ASW11-75]
MQTDGIRGSRLTARTVLTALLLALPLTAAAQDVATESGAIPDNYYRAELVVLERIVEPEAVNERMGDRAVEPTPESNAILRAVDASGTANTTLDLVPTSELHLSSAVQRLERSGRYRVLVAAGWYEAFPPDYQGEPLKVAVGDWLNGAETREIEGTISIDRQRYLHVGVNLNHWQLAPMESMAPEPMRAEPVAGEEAPADVNAEAGDDSAAETGATPVAEMTQTADKAPLELLTWIRETRRMRSEEIHFLDSPTIGVLVFFKRIEASE